jgi:outer membrane scaffolding protein for murein synthesis (MipA/OmpV family)
MSIKTGFYTNYRVNGAIAGCLVLAIAAASVERATAQDLEEQEITSEGLSKAKPRGWDLVIGGGVGARPTYEGSKSYEAVPIPFVALTYDDLVSLSPEGIRVNVVRLGGFTAGPVLGYLGGRKESDDTALRGLGNVQSSVTGGGFVTYEMRPFELSATIRQSIVHSKNGLEAELQASYGLKLSDSFGLRIGPEIAFSDGRYNQTFFGVTAAQSRASGLHVFTPSGGVKDVGLQASLLYKLDDRWGLRGISSIKELVGDAGSSPIVHSRTQVFTGLGIAYRF